jgi:hypothetical protein
LCSGALYPYVGPPRETVRRRIRRKPAPHATTMRFLLRFIGLWLLAGAFVALIIDGTASIAGGSLRYNTFGQTWDNIHQDSKPAVKAFLDRRAGRWLWNSGVQVVLDQPTWLVLGALGTVLVLLGRKKPRLIGYARE